MRRRTPKEHVMAGLDPAIQAAKPAVQLQTGFRGSCRAKALGWPGQAHGLSGSCAAPVELELTGVEGVSAVGRV